MGIRKTCRQCCGFPYQRRSKKKKVLFNISASQTLEDAVGSCCCRLRVTSAGYLISSKGPRQLRHYNQLDRVSKNLFIYQWCSPSSPACTHTLMHMQAPAERPCLLISLCQQSNDRQRTRILAGLRSKPVCPDLFHVVLTHLSTTTLPLRTHLWARGTSATFH